MALPAIFDKLRLPVIGSPLFIVSSPELVIAQCKAGVVGSFPALNARPQTQLDEWLHRLRRLCRNNRDTPTGRSAYAVNQIVHKIEHRREKDMITSANAGRLRYLTGAREDLTRRCKRGRDFVHAINEASHTGDREGEEASFRWRRALADMQLPRHSR